MATAIEIAREYLPRLADEELDHVIWEYTGFPSFWNIPKDGNTPEECFRKQLLAYARAHTEAFAQILHDIWDKPWIKKPNGGET